MCFSLDKLLTFPSFPSAVLSGDYYMFEDMPEADLIDPTDVGRKEDEEEEDKLAGQLTISKVSKSSPQH